MAAWAALLRVHAALVRTFEQEVEGATGLPLSWYDVLLELNQASGRRLRMQELGERVVLSRSRVSRVVEDMVAAELVAKEPDPTDARATLATLTATGRRALRRAAPVYLAGISRDFTAHLAPKQLDAIRTGLERVLDSQVRSSG